jgi:saccharopine dehydrogenase (NAD+, L-lysine-forming)
MKSIFIRRELNPNEHRAPIVPKDAAYLISKDVTVFCQKATNRIYTDSEYEEAGVILTDDEWYENKYKDTLIIGLKDLQNLDKLSKHKHMYFSHSFKNQNAADTILSAFTKSNSVIYDFEYFTNSENKRLIAFGYYAGVAAAHLGIKQYLNRLLYNTDINNLSNSVPIELEVKYAIKVAIIGAEGRCGLGVRSILEKYKIAYDTFSKDSNMDTLITYDIIFNCILLDESYTNVWFDNTTIFTKHIVIVDISCDYSKVNNPIKLYSSATSWITPVFNYNSLVDIIAIDNLPSLLPKESSDMFSSICKDLLLQFGSEIWEKCLDKFHLAVKTQKKS